MSSELLLAEREIELALGRYARACRYSGSPRETFAFHAISSLPTSACT